MKIILKWKVEEKPVTVSPILRLFFFFFFVTDQWKCNMLDRTICPTLHCFIIGCSCIQYKALVSKVRSEATNYLRELLPLISLHQHFSPLSSPHLSSPHLFISTSSLFFFSGDADLVLTLSSDTHTHTHPHALYTLVHKCVDAKKGRTAISVHTCTQRHISAYKLQHTDMWMLDRTCTRERRHTPQRGPWWSAHAESVTY